MVIFQQWIPSGYVKIAIENGPVEIVDFPIKNGGSFYSKLLVYQRVVHNIHWLSRWIPGEIPGRVLDDFISTFYGVNGVTRPGYD